MKNCSADAGCGTDDSSFIDGQIIKVDGGFEI